MCHGINARRRLLGPVAPNPIPKDVDADYLTYRGGGRGGSGTEKRVKCTGFCDGCNRNNPRSWSCDEYPPAAFKESATDSSQGESFSSRVCIPLKQNNRQGGLLSGIVRRCRLSGKEQKVKIRVEGLEGGCQGVVDEGACNPSFQKEKRESADANSTTTADETVIDLFADGSQYAVAVDLGELPNGTHSYRVSTNSSVDYMAVIASDGYEYAAHEGSDGTSAVFDITVEDAEDLTLWAFLHDNQAVNLSYTLNNTTQPSAQAAGARRVSKAGLGWYVIGIFGCVVTSYLSSID